MTLEQLKRPIYNRYRDFYLAKAKNEEERLSILTIYDQRLETFLELCRGEVMLDSIESIDMYLAATLKDYETIFNSSQNMSNGFS